MAYRLGVDVGGTFTDLLLFHEESGPFWRRKRLLGTVRENAHNFQVR